MTWWCNLGVKQPRFCWGFRFRIMIFVENCLHQDIDKLVASWWEKKIQTKSPSIRQKVERWKSGISFCRFLKGRGCSRGGGVTGEPLRIPFGEDWENLRRRLGESPPLRIVRPWCKSVLAKVGHHHSWSPSVFFFTREFPAPFFCWKILVGIC